MVDFAHGSYPLGPGARERVLPNQFSNQPPLSRTHPELVQFWDVKRNGDLTPDDVVAGSAKKAYWLCQKGHTIYVEVRRKVNGDECGICANRVLQTGVNDLATVYPEISSQWHPTKNGHLKPTEVLFGARLKVWWICEKGHEWQAFIYSRNPATQGCMACINRILVKGENDLESCFPDIAAEWDLEKNGGLTASDVTYGTPKTYYWRCSKGHSFKLSVHSRTKRNASCKYCSGNAVEPGVSDLETLYPEIARRLSQTQNSSIRASEIAPGSHKRYVWNCDKGHTFTSPPRQLIKGLGCGVCGGKQVLAGFNDLATRFPRVAQEWHPELNGGLEASQFTPGSYKVVWWRCPKGHDYQMRIDNRCFLDRKCAVCANRQVQIGVNDLASFRPDLALEWDTKKNGNLLPTDVTYESTRKAWWLCLKGHSFYSQINFRSTRNVGCPKCSKAGFDQSSPSVFYFIQNPALAARKVGIANKTSQRLAMWLSKGWSIVFSVESRTGTKVLELETRTLKWIRKDLGLPPYLGDKELGAIGGWSETFSIEGVSNEVILAKIKTLIAELEELS